MNRGIHADHKLIKAVSLRGGKKHVCLQYFERRDGSSALLKLNDVCLEAGPPEKIRRVFNQLVKRHYAKRGKQAPKVSLLEE